MHGLRFIAAAALALVAAAPASASAPAGMPPAERTSATAVRNLSHSTWAGPAPLQHANTVRSQAVDPVARAAPNVRFAGLTPVAPTRVLDTRVAIGTPTTSAVPAGSSMSVRVAGIGGVPTTGVEAVAVNVTVTEPTAPSYITVWPTGSTRPGTSNLNMLPGDTNPNLVISKVGSDGSIDLYNAFGSTHLVVDLVGWSAHDGHLRALQPARVLDTRSAVGVDGTSPVGPGAIVDLDLAGRGGLPQERLGAVILNVTVTEPTAPSFITVWPTGEERPLASSLNMLPGDTNPNLVISRVGPTGQVSLYNAFGSTHLIADVVGFIPSGSAYVPINPTRVLDTRDGSGTYGNLITTSLGFEILRPRQLDFRTWLRENDTVQLEVANALGLPGTTTALVVNITATNASAPTYVSTWAHGDPQPSTSTLNLLPGDTVPNLAVIEVGDDGYVDLFNRFGHVDLIVDVVGYFIARSVDDHVDEVDGSQIHVIHLQPSDIGTPSFDDDDIRHTLDVAESWLEKTGGRGFRFDEYDGSIEISRLRSERTSAEIAEEVFEPYGEIIDWMVADGYGESTKIYLVFADGVDTGNQCGRQFSIGNEDGWTNRLAMVFGDACNFDGAGFRPNSTNDWEHLGAARITVHELLHAMGASASCGADEAGGSHVGDERDIMFGTRNVEAGGAATDGADTVLDAGNDDYWGRGYEDCDDESVPDVSLSPFLDAPRR